MPSSNARFYATRLKPGEELLSAFRDFFQREGLQAAFIAGCVGSLTEVSLRYAGKPECVRMTGKFEVVSLIGTLDSKAPHIHIIVSDETGHTVGGHLLEGCTVRTTLEVIFGELEELKFDREHCPLSGYDELVIHKRSAD
ncbi:putative DNA-binding protein [Planoprotostelium fungivorum]|uniref:Putative DNA-binding protein n=1 Tax=Planoprotostelium fungivorum TaxID=1890364 RepID=A0A2P6NGJ9_9EUKA|nr:putative DNA-binding protein [Planoprotostelium fungivorum]